MTGTSALPSANSTTECVGPGRATRPAWLSGWRGARPLVGPEHSRSEAGERRRHRLTRGNTNAQFGRHATSPGEYARATASAFTPKRSLVRSQYRPPSHRYSNPGPTRPKPGTGRHPPWQQRRCDGHLQRRTPPGVRRCVLPEQCQTLRVVLPGVGWSPARP